MTAPLPPPGWYPDPRGTGGRAYWTGTAWGKPPVDSRAIWKVVGIVGGLILFASCVGSVLSKDKDNDATSATTTTKAFAAPTTTAHAPSPKQLPGTGQEVRDGKFGFVVTGVETRQGSLGGLSDPPMGEWVIVSVTVSNVGDQQRTFSASNQKLIDSQRREFESDFWATEALNDDFSVDLNPGFTVSFKIPFDVPPGTVPAGIELHDSAFSGGVTVALK